MAQHRFQLIRTVVSLAPQISQVMMPPIELRGGTQQKHFPMMMTTEQPEWFVRDHMYASGSDPNAAAWRLQIIRPYQPASLHENYAPWRHQNMYQQPPLANQPTVPTETNFVQQHIIVTGDLG